MTVQTYFLPSGKAALLAFIERLPVDKKWRVTIERYKKIRSLDQNAISHAWYTQISRELQEYTPETVKRMCKLDYGIPILRGDSQIFNTFCKKAIDPLLLREDKVAAMQFIDVTSLMKTDQFTEYLDAVQKAYEDRIQLRFPNE